ncbi:helix-turn-helix domain-containing protein [Corynebacterium amycolatum]|uniref:helix-turn-helix domain-containing protein n=1 Tax=Corynebacterium amycolatum TaxID=43765 RepID=UPI00234D902C|nr:helix-turn-helix domain-containing protein [Corynebacterium amycolatum]MDC7116125.1 helix-turn-helix domain-containing protein [Corynebacterium amycolatum]
MKTLSGVTYLSPDEFAEAANCHPETVREACRRDEIPGATQRTRRGRWKIPASSVSAFARGQEFYGGDAA